MICGRCNKNFKTFPAYARHRARCRERETALWGQHYAAVQAGKHRKASRLARKLLGVETPRMPTALLERFKDPAVQKASREKSKAKRRAVRRMQADLAAAGRRRRRILS